MDDRFIFHRTLWGAGLLVVLLLSGCASSLKEIPVETVQVCEKGRCGSLGKEVAVDSFLSRFYGFLGSHIGQDTVVSEADPATGRATSNNIKYYTQGGPLPFFVGIDSIKFTDVLFLDREKREIRFKMRPWSHYLGVPVLCAEGEGSLTVASPQDVSLQVSTFCTWMIVGTNTWEMKMRLDRIDLDRDAIAGNYSVGHVGPLTLGKGSGYQVARFQPAAFTAEAKASSQSSAAALPEQPVPLPDITYNTVFSDASNDSVLDPGEKVALSVEIANNGKTEARDIAILLTGTPLLVDLLGARKDVDALPAGGRATALFEAVLPRPLPIDTADLRVEVRQGNIPAASGARSLRFAARRGEQHETVQVFSQPPRLEYALDLKDANGNRILEAGEDVRLAFTISNRGEGDARDVKLRLSGSKTLVSLFGETREVGALAPGESRTLELKGTMPTALSSESAELRIELTEGRGFAPPESRVLRVATKGAERKEVLEVVSELSVDEIPPKVTGNVRPDDVAVVIGIGSYREESIPAVKYARRDAEVLAKYLENLSGVPKENIALLTDDRATKSDIEAYLTDWLPRRVKPSSNVYLFYAGHGAPDLAGKGAYLVPYEGHPDFTSKLIPLQGVYQALNTLPARQVVVFLDSCFSGAQGRGIAQSGVRPLVVTTERQLQADGKAVVLASASGSEVTSDYEKVRHGLFTFYLLKGLRGEADADGDGTVTIGELYGFVGSQVGRTASLELNRTQTPVLIPLAARERKDIGLTRTHSH